MSRLRFPRPASAARPLRSAVAAACAAVALGACGFSFEYSPDREVVPIPPGVPPDTGEPVPPIDIHAPGRTADQLTEWAAPISENTRVPRVALEAYGNAAEIMRQTQPECRLDWTTLAGVGWVESRHGHIHGSALDADGVARPPVVGVPLDGSDGLELIPDTDGGELDGDTEFDRAVGPMQFIPETWRQFGTDANGDGVADPNQIDDAAVAAARLLCGGGRDLSVAEDWQAAILAYNASREYVASVRDAAAAYSVQTNAPR